MTWLLPPLPPNWEAALRDVRAKHADSRLAAAQRLATPEPDEQERALAGLLTLAKDADQRVRAAAFQSLADLADPGALSVLVEGTRDSESSVRELAVIALGRLPAEHGADALLEATRSPHPEVRFQAVLSAAEQPGGQAEATIVRLLRDDDARVRANAVRAASVLPAQQRSTALLTALADLLDDSDAHARAEAAVLLAATGELRAVEGLLRALSDSELVWQALEAAPAVVDPRVRESVATIAQSFLKPRAIVAAAGRALVRMGDPRGVSALREVLFALRGDGRSYAVEVIGELKITELLPELERLSKHPKGVDPELIAKVRRTLGPSN